MKLCVTGGAGFIGSNFINYMLKKYDYEIVCFDKLTYAGNLSSLNDAMKYENFSFVKGDITDRYSVYELFEKERFDMVVNFAAESHVDRSIKDPEVFIRTNVIGTMVLMDACIKYKVKRFHQISTDEVYGDVGIDDNVLFDEDCRLNPSSPYSASKASSDMMVKAYYRTYGLPISISRSSNNYGPNQYPEKLIPLMIFKATKNESLPVYGDGKNVRSWLYVLDHCKAVDLIIHNGKIGEIYNISTDNNYSNNEIIRRIIKELKSESDIVYVKDRLGHDLKYAVNSEKIKTELGWKPEIEFETGLKQTVEWYKYNKNLN